MPASTKAPESAIESPDWHFTEEDAPKPTALVIQLRRGALVLPWFRFAFADGDNTQVNVVFATHAIKITGHGLAALLVALAGQRVSRVIEPSDNEAKFGVRGSSAGKYHGPAIHSIVITKFE